MGTAEDVGIAGRETDGISQSDDVAADEMLVLVFRRLRVVVASVDVAAIVGIVGLGVHQVLVQLDASGAAESEVVSVAVKRHIRKEGKNHRARLRTVLPMEQGVAYEGWRSGGRDCGPGVTRHQRGCLFG
jgi:hypothetical protein